MASSERIFRILDTEADVQEPKQPKALPTPVRGEVEFKDVWFSSSGVNGGQGAEVGTTSESQPAIPNPQSPDWVLRGVSLKISAGQSVAVVGATGAGKTSLISLLARFYDIQGGAITLDGVALRDVPQSELRRHIGAVPQDPV